MGYLFLTVLLVSIVYTLKAHGYVEDSPKSLRETKNEIRLRVGPAYMIVNNLHRIRRQASKKKKKFAKIKKVKKRRRKPKNKTKKPKKNRTRTNKVCRFNKTINKTAYHARFQEKWEQNRIRVSSEAAFLDKMMEEKVKNRPPDTRIKLNESAFTKLKKQLSKKIRLRQREFRKEVKEYLQKLKLLKSFTERVPIIKDGTKKRQIAKKKRFRDLPENIHNRNDWRRFVMKNITELGVEKTWIQKLSLLMVFQRAMTTGQNTIPQITHIFLSDDRGCRNQHLGEFYGKVEDSPPKLFLCGMFHFSVEFTPKRNKF
uniref:Uncharacterized protein n=1 Tax=Cacopsylla melanoneura TaxID=428564 RepID=A0A8D8WZH8_9HEMI